MTWLDSLNFDIKFVKTKKCFETYRKIWGYGRNAACIHLKFQTLRYEFLSVPLISPILDFLKISKEENKNNQSKTYKFFRQQT